MPDVPPAVCPFEPIFGENSLFFTRREPSAPRSASCQRPVLSRKTADIGPTLKTNLLLCCESKDQPRRPSWLRRPPNIGQVAYQHPKTPYPIDAVQNDFLYTPARKAECQEKRVSHSQTSPTLKYPKINPSWRRKPRLSEVVVVAAR